MAELYADYSRELKKNVFRLIVESFYNSISKSHKGSIRKEKCSRRKEK